MNNLAATLFGADLKQVQVRDGTRIESNEYTRQRGQSWKAHSLWRRPDEIGLAFVPFGLRSSTHRGQCVDFDSIAPQMLGPVQRGIREADEDAKFRGFVA